eukprot:7016107-Karenia_brevis.AAC.1
MWNEGEAIAIVADTLSGLTHNLRAVRGNIKGAWSLLTAWRRKELPAQALPLPNSILFALLGLSLHCDLPRLGV